jgi:hypothetical protein
MLVLAPLLSAGQNKNIDLGQYYGSWDCDSKENLKVVFEVAVSKDGKVTRIHLKERPDSVSQKLIRKLEKGIKKLDWKTSKAVGSTGKLTYCIRKKDD